MESLDYVIQILSSNQLFMPNLNGNKNLMDSEVQNWLNAMITNNSNAASYKSEISASLNNDPTKSVILYIYVYIFT